MRWLVLFVVVLAAAVGGAYAGLPWILESVIVQQAAARGIEVSELRIRRPVWGLAVVDRIALRVGANDVQAETVAIGFTWDSLSMAQATDVTVSRLNVAARPDESAGAQPVDVGELIGTLPALLVGAWELVPAQSLVAEEVRIELAGMDFSGALELSPAKVSLQGRVTGPRPVPPLQIAARLDASGKLHAEVGEVDVAGHVLRVDGDLGSASGTLAGSWTFTFFSEEVAEEQTDDASITVGVAGSAPFALSDTGWVLESGLAAVVEAAQWRAALDVADAAGSWRPESGELARVLGIWHGQLQLAEASISAHGGVSAAFDGTLIELGLDPGTVLSTTQVAGDDWSVGGANIELVDGARLEVAPAPLSYRLQSSARLAAQLDRVVWSEYALSPLVDITMEELNGDLEAIAAGLQLQIPALQLTGSARATGTLPGGPYAIEFDTEQRFSQSFLAGLFPDASEVYDVDAGRLDTSGTVRLSAVESGEFAGAMSLTLADLGVHYKDMVASGINAQLAVELDDGAWRVGPDRLAVGLVDVGFPVTDLAADIALTSELLNVSGLTARALGGSLAVAAMEYDIADGASQFLTQATAVQLAQVLALEGDTVTGSGTLDGELPVQITENQVRVSEGRFSAREPGGVLRYSGAEEGAALLDQPGIGFAIAPLGDFRYGVLDVGVSYEPNGDLLLGVHLEGSNPRFEDGRPFHYNLNISENIPVLLRSLQLSDEVGKRLEQRLEQQ